MNPADIELSVGRGEYDAVLSSLYGAEKLLTQRSRLIKAARRFAHFYGESNDAHIFSAPGRTEIGGNHTDHQRGRVLAAAVDMDMLCLACRNNNGIIRIKSEGFPDVEIDSQSLEARKEDAGSAAALVRGVAARCRELGYSVSGFDAYISSDVLKGSGLSSSAAFEVAVGTMINRLFNSGRISPVEIAQIGQYAENVYFGKPSGLMDQIASSVGGFVAIDFADPEKPVIEPVSFDFAGSGYCLCIVDTGGNHSGLTGEYAAIPNEMRLVAEFFGKNYLRQVDESEFYSCLAQVREKCGDRSILRAIHFFDDNNRVPRQAEALKSGNFAEFLRLVNESGRSSALNLQNIFSCSSPQEQGLSLALTLSERLLSGQGALRVHGGGIAGTIQAFVPNCMVDSYVSYMDSVFGYGCCHRLSIRPVGGIEITIN